MASYARTVTRKSSLAQALPWIALIAVWVVWGSTYLAIRVAVQTIPPLLMPGMRYVIAGATLALVLLVLQRKRLAPLGRNDAAWIVIAAVLMLLVGNGALCYAEVTIPSGMASLIAASTPIWMLLIDAAFTRKLQRLAAFGVAAGTIGMIVLVGAPGGRTALLPALAVLAGAFSWAFGSVLARRYHAHRTNPLFPALEMFAGGVLLCAAGAASGEISAFHVAEISAASYAGFWWLVVMGAIVGYTAYGYAVRTLPTNVVSTYAYVNPVVAVTLGALVLGERLTPNVLVGGTIVVAAVALILFAGRKTRQTQHLQEDDYGDEMDVRAGA